MVMPVPEWWGYARLEDVEGVGVVKGFKKGTPKKVLENYKEYVKGIEDARRKDPYIKL